MILLRQTGTLYPNRSAQGQSRRYASYRFSLSGAAKALTISLHVHSDDYIQLPLALFYRDESIRILKASDGTQGDYTYRYVVGEEENTKGSISGTLEKGEYLLIIYKRRMGESVPYTLRVTAEEKTDIQMIPPPVITFDKRIKNPQKGWYKGELHVHSTQSTGREGIKSLLAFCRDHAIDFIAFTDHFTASHWEEIERTDSDLLPLCLRSMEISGDKGHMNAHGLSSWINPLVDDNEWLGFTTPPSMVSIADEVHRQGGIVSINHPLSGLVSWHYPDFPMEKADLLEIWCTADYQTTALYPTFWDQYLKMGLHITGVGSSDSHHSTDIPGWQMGKIHTWVLADNLGQEALIKALKSGQAYVSYGKSELRFEAHTPSHCYQMGETIKKGETPSFFITLLHHPSGHLIIYRDGFQEDSVYFPEEEESHYSFTLPSFSYCRIEFHEDIKKTRFWGMVFRDWQSMRLLSNPIWMEK